MRKAKGMMHGVPLVGFVLHASSCCLLCPIQNLTLSVPSSDPLLLTKQQSLGLVIQGMGRGSTVSWAPAKIKELLKVQLGSPSPQILIWRCSQIHRQPSWEHWLGKPKRGKAGLINVILFDFLLLGQDHCSLAYF